MEQSEMTGQIYIEETSDPEILNLTHLGATTEPEPKRRGPRSKNTKQGSKPKNAKTVDSSGSTMALILYKDGRKPDTLSMDDLNRRAYDIRNNTEVFRIYEVVRELHIKDTFFEEVTK